MKYINKLKIERVEYYSFDMVYVPSGEVFQVDYEKFEKFFKIEINGEKLCKFNKEIDKWTIDDKFRKEFNNILKKLR